MNKRYLGVYLRGLAMGAADVVPGVSGGTVAFITGIYEELLNSIKSINPSSAALLFKQGPAAFWAHINGTFLLALGLGIITSIVSLARVISLALESQPLLVWSFFFGLILASSWHMAKQVRHWHWQTVAAMLLGVVIAYTIAELKPSELPPQLGLVFLSGCVAICAMILPGISGSFILLLLGMYGHVLGAIKSFDWLLLSVFAAGCGVGLLSFSHLLSWLLARFHDTAMTLLTGFLLGSLYLIWPWKQALTFYENSKGKQMVLTQQNILPSDYVERVGQSPETVLCAFLMALGIICVLVLEKIGAKKD